MYEESWFFSVYSLKVRINLHAINFNGDANYWCLFRSGVREKSCKKF